MNLDSRIFVAGHRGLVGSAARGNSCGNRRRARDRGYPALSVLDDGAGKQRKKRNSGRAGRRLVNADVLAAELDLPADGGCTWDIDEWRLRGLVTVS